MIRGTEGEVLFQEDKHRLNFLTHISNEEAVQRGRRQRAEPVEVCASIVAKPVGSFRANDLTNSK